MTIFKQVGHETLTQRNEIFMDIIILDNVPNGRINRIVHAKVCNIIKMFLNAQLNVGSKNKWMRLKSRCLMLFPKNAVFYFLNFFEKINNKKDTELCRVYTYTQASGWGVPAKCYKKYRNIEFEKRTFMCFGDYDSSLKYASGEKYMELKPKSKRKPHINVYELNFGNLFEGGK